MSHLSLGWEGHPSLPSPTDVRLLADGPTGALSSGLSAPLAPWPNGTASDFAPRAVRVKDVAAAGGWKDVTTLLTCYQHADEATILKVMASPVRLVGRAAVGVVEKR